MKLHSIFAAVALVATASSSFAATGTSAFIGGVADFVNPAPIAAGSFSDSISFTGIAAGTYDIVLDFSGQSLWVTGLTLNGVAADSISNVGTTKGGKFSFAFMETEANAPFTLNVMGMGFAAKTPVSYSGSLTAVAAVPEPETYALMLAGLAGVGFVTRRRQAKQS
ncbi:hypothetical protein BH11PSE8_BH11PSE8_07330 [soil metagenome]